MTISRAMLTAYLTLAAGILAMPHLVALIPETYLPFIACASGVIALVLRWLNGALGANTLSLVGVATLVAGLLSVPELLAVIPLTAMPIITALSGILTLISRYLAGQSAADPAVPVNALFRTK